MEFLGDQGIWQAFAFTGVVDGERHFATINCRLVDDQTAEVDMVAFGTHPVGSFLRQTMYDDNRRIAFGDFIPLAGESGASASGWNALG